MAIKKVVLNNCANGAIVAALTNLILMMPVIQTAALKEAAVKVWEKRNYGLLFSQTRSFSE